MIHPSDSTLTEQVPEALSAYEPDSVAKALSIVLNAATRVGRIAVKVLQARGGL